MAMVQWNSWLQVLYSSILQHNVFFHRCKRCKHIHHILGCKQQNTKIRKEIEEKRERSSPSDRSPPGKISKHLFLPLLSPLGDNEIWIGYHVYYFWTWHPIIERSRFSRRSVTTWFIRISVRGTGAIWTRDEKEGRREEAPYYSNKSCPGWPKGAFFNLFSSFLWQGSSDKLFQ